MAPITDRRIRTAPPAPLAPSDAVRNQPIPRNDWLARVIDRAERRLYFNLGTVSDPKVVDRLIAAHRRGVTVRLTMTAGDFASPALRAAHQRLEAAGIDVVVRRRVSMDPGSGIADGSAFDSTAATVDRNAASVIRFERRFESAFPSARIERQPYLIEKGTVELHPMPSSTAAPILRAINAAKSSIDLSIYEMSDPTIIQALLAADKRGVRVRVMLEPEPVAHGNYAKLSKELRASGVEVRTTPPRFSEGFNVDHAKFMIVDGHEAIIGTGNFKRSSLGGNEDPAFNNRDFFIEDARVETVREAKKLFQADWYRRPTDGMRFDNLVVTPDNSEQKVFDLIDSAKDRLWVYNQSLTDAETVDRLLAAKARGVDVRVLVGKAEDGRKNLPALKKLWDAGVKATFFDRHYLHAKGIIADGRAFIGSQNFTNGGMENNREVGMVLDDRGVVGELTRVFLYDWRNPTSGALN